MAFRTDVSVDWSTSPRIITVQAPATQINLQDLVDTCRELEQQSHNMTYASLISAAGKEALGGGVLVGITATLQNAVVAFEGRTGSDSSGTVTSADATGTILTDASGTFVTDGIVSGDTIYNMTDESITSVIEVISETQLRHYPLADGTDNDWDISDSYKIWNKIQCEINGGNLVAVDDVGSDISPILPTAQTHIVRTSSSSATLQEQEDIQFASFNNFVHINVTTGVTGTNFPNGTARQPVNNLTDAKAIANERGITRLKFETDYTFVSGDSVTLFELHGETAVGTTLTFQSGSTSIGAEFFDCTVDGIMVSPQAFTRCDFKDIVGNTIGLAGTIIAKDCAFLSSVTLSASLEGDIHLINCYSGIAGGATPVFDVNGANVNVLARNYAGGMEIRNFSYVGGKEMSLDFNSGNCVIADTCTTGNIILRGVGRWANRDVYVGTSAITDNFVTQEDVEYASFGGTVHIDTATGVAGTTFPKGTVRLPVNNLTDAITIANARGFDSLTFESDYTFVIGDSVNFFNVHGSSEISTTLTFDVGSTCIGTKFFTATIQGTLVSPQSFTHCEFLNITGGTIGVAGTIFLDHCGFFGTVTLSNALEGEIHIVDCHSAVPGTTTPIFDTNGADVDVLVRNYSGGMEIRNFTNVAANVMSLDFVSGAVIIADSCTTGAVTLRGNGTWLNKATYAGTTSVADLLINQGAIADAVWDDAVTDHTTPGSFGEYMTLFLSKLNAILGLS